MSDRVLVYGGRDYDDWPALRSVLDDLEFDLIISGGASGADRMGEAYAARDGLPLAVMPAHWGYYGRVAGPTRNAWMLDRLNPTLAVECPGGKGTAHMRSLLDKAGVRVIEVQGAGGGE
jgi:hypothetical protein